LTETIARARSFLFVPGDRPDRFAKAFASGADVVVLDLEDAVPANARAEARTNVRSWLEAGHRSVVRINARGTSDFEKDIAAMAGYDFGAMLAKTVSPVDVEAVCAGLGDGVPIVALVESATGILAAPRIAAAPGVVRLAFGSIDYAAELGLDLELPDSLLFAQGALVVASAAAGISSPIDGVATSFVSADAVREEATRGRRLGFSGKLCIHPNQIEPVHAGYAPSDHDVDWARRIVAVGTPGGATALNGEMVDAPVVARARRILAASPRIFDES
jgi:citrate lyase subunit beta/citryl-CoA lyase